MNRIYKVLKTDKKILSVYFTAGYPKLDDTVTILQNLEAAKVDMVEIGLPFSDPIADGPTIQNSSAKALANGITTEKLFQQLQNIRETVRIPLVIMGYFNPIMQYGVEAFCKQCAAIGIDGLIIPDLPVEVYQKEYQQIFRKFSLPLIFLITPKTSEERIRFIDSLSECFIYMVSSASVTGAKNKFDDIQKTYFKRIAKMQLKTPQIVGFGISNSDTFKVATTYTKGAIIGSAFIKHITHNGINSVKDFIDKIRI